MCRPQRCDRMRLVEASAPGHPHLGGGRGVSLVGADLDETPMAYRRLDEVLAPHSRSVKILHRPLPFAVAMAGEGTFDPFKD